jgi:hypothetical protein
MGRGQHSEEPRVVMQLVRFDFKDAVTPLKPYLEIG